MTLTIAEELLLLGYHDETGRPQAGSVELDAAVAGALLAELAVAGRIDLRDDMVMVTDRSPVGDEELDAVLARVHGEPKPRKAQWWVERLRSGELRKRLLRRLAERGVLSEETTKLFGLIPLRRYPERDPSAEQEIRRRIENVLTGADPDPRTAVLISLLHAARLDRKAFPKTHRRRIKEIAEGEWAGAAVYRAIVAVQAAVTAAVAAAIAATSAAAGS